MSNIEKNLLNKFGSLFIKYGRDRTIKESIDILEGRSKDRISKIISENLQSLSGEQRAAVEDFLIDAVDGALDNFLWMIEQSEEFDLVAYNDKGTYSLDQISDGLSVDYWNFVDEFSKFKRLDDEE